MRYVEDSRSRSDDIQLFLEQGSLKCYDIALVFGGFDLVSCNWKFLGQPTLLVRTLLDTAAYCKRCGRSRARNLVPYR